MAYWIARNNQKAGPYSLSDVQRMMADGKLLASDLAWADGMANWGPVFDVVPAPQAPEVPAQAAVEPLAPTRMMPVMRLPDAPAKPQAAPAQQSAPAQSAPVQPGTYQQNPAQSAPAQSAPVQPGTYQQNPAQSAPAQSAPVQPGPYQPNPTPANAAPAYQQPSYQQPPYQQQQPYQAQPYQPGPYSPSNQPAPPNPSYNPSGSGPSASAAPPPAQAYQPYPAQPMPAQPYPAQPMGPMGNVAGPIPPDMHWAVVWILSGVTLGIFYLVWVFKQANFVKRLDPANPSRMLFVVTVILGAAYGAFIGVAVVMQSQAALTIALGAGALVELAAVVCNLIAVFKMRSSLLNYYNTVEPIGLRLSAVMTFFFNILYFQHHFSRIAKWKQTGMLEPQR